MANYEMKEGKGTMFPNSRKESEAHPDLKGDALINGKQYWLSGWKKTTQNGTEYISISIQPKQSGD